MNTRTCSVVAMVTLLMMTAGCSGTRSCLLGRGARCGQSEPTPDYGAPQQSPCAPNPCTPQATCNPGVVSSPQVSCGCGTSYSSDPYMSGEVIGSMPYEGQIMGVTEGVVGGDNFVPSTRP
jgi:hypothetical protein